MTKVKRPHIEVTPDMHQTLKIKAAQCGMSVYRYTDCLFKDHFDRLARKEVKETSHNS